jgi:hypothetical protein
MRFKGAMRHCKPNLPLYWAPICRGEHASKGSATHASKDQTFLCLLNFRLTKDRNNASYGWYSSNLELKYWNKMTVFKSISKFEIPANTAVT